MSPDAGDRGPERLEQAHQHGGDAARADHGYGLAEQALPGRLTPGPGAGPDPQQTRAGQDQRERVLGDRFGERALGRGPPPVRVDHPGLERSLHPGLRQLDPGDLGPGGQHGAQGVHGAAVRPDQALGVLVQRDRLPAAAADRLGGPGRGPGPDRDAGRVHDTPMMIRSLALVCVAPVSTASPQASRSAVVACSTSPFRKLSPSSSARPAVEESTRPPAIAVPPSEPSVSANNATIPGTPSRASAAPTAASWLGPPRPNSSSASGPRLTVVSPPPATTTVPRGQGEPLTRDSRASVARTRPAVAASPSSDPPSRTPENPRAGAALRTASLPSWPRASKMVWMSASRRAGEAASRPA